MSIRVIFRFKPLVSVLEYNAHFVLFLRMRW